MKLENELDSSLCRLAEAVSKIDGVLAAILFGSRARGDYNEHSDYDLLVVFTDDDTMWRTRPQLYRKVAELCLFTQVLTRSLRELREETEPTFLKTVLEHGKLIYARHPIEFPAFQLNLAPVTIISYSLKGLPQKRKLAVTYRLFGRKKRGEGLVQKLGGTHLGYGVVMVCREHANEVISLLRSYGATYRITEVFVVSEKEPVI